MKTTVAIVDDHVLMGQALNGLISALGEYDVLYDVSSGKDLIQKIQTQARPDIVLLDVNMPIMNGFEVASWLKENCPEIKILALSMNDKEEAIVSMLRNGAKGYLLKGCKSAELKLALDTIKQSGFYYTEFIARQLIKSLDPESTRSTVSTFGLNQRELTFLKLACSDLTYNQIADQMCLSPRTVDGYREVIFQKMDVKSRVGMVIEAIRSGIVQI